MLPNIICRCFSSLVPNALLTGIPSCAIKSLQMIQYTAAHLFIILQWLLTSSPTQWSNRQHLPTWTPLSRSTGHPLQDSILPYLALISDETEAFSLLDVFILTTLLLVAHLSVALDQTDWQMTKCKCNPNATGSETNTEQVGNKNWDQLFNFDLISSGWHAYQAKIILFFSQPADLVQGQWSREPLKTWNRCWEPSVLWGNIFIKVSVYVCYCILPIVFCSTFISHWVSPLFEQMNVFRRRNVGAWLLGFFPPNIRGIFLSTCYCWSLLVLEFSWHLLIKMKIQNIMIDT